ncbi:MAG TPA: choice-of-anchor tandem repeat NxxGxxAF-containing protein, partial [Tepidisphaeraceae bacterium]|nr:choice-of-anchor tandem repeat NxxGxxAF-containing protein [Tepidisphaeraceae bacterium]
MRKRTVRRNAALVSAVSVMSLVPAAYGQVRPATQIVTPGQATGITNVNINTVNTSSYPVQINSAGTVYFWADLAGSGVTPVNSGGVGDSQAAFIGSGGGLTLAMRRDALAPGFPEPDPEDPFITPTFFGKSGSSAFTTFVGSASPAMDDLGNLVFRSAVRGGSVVTGIDDAIYFGQPGSLTRVALEGEALPASITAAGVPAGYKMGQINFNGTANNGRTAFMAESLYNNLDAELTNNDALFVANTSGALTLIAFAAPAGGTTIGADNITALSTGKWTIDSGGQVLFGGTLNGTTAFLARGTSSAGLTMVAKVGDASPIGGGVNYSALDFTDRAAIGNFVAFQATLTGTGVVTTGATKNDKAFFQSGGDGILKTLVRENDALPAGFAYSAADLPAGSTEMRFAGLDNMKLSSSGWTAFSATLRGSAQSTPGTTYDATYVGRINPGTGLPEVKKVAQENDRAGFSQSAIHVERGDFAWALDKWNGVEASSSGTSTQVNANGQVVFFAGANSPGSVLTEVSGYFFYDPSLGRVFRLVAPGDELMHDPDGPGPLPAVAKIVGSVTAQADSGGGEGDGRAHSFNANGQLAFRASFNDGTSGVFRLDVEDYVPTSFHVWNQAAGGEWSTAGNWTGGAADGIKTYAEFAAGISAPANVTVTGPKTVGEVYFKNANKVTLSGDALTLSGVGGLAHLGVGQGDHEIANDVVLSTDASVIADDSFSSPGGVATYTPTSLTISGDISGSGDLRKGGPGVLKLTGVNSYTGDTHVRAGYVEIGAASGLGATTNTTYLDGGIIRTTAGLTDPRAIVVTNVTRDTSDVKGGIDTGANTVTWSGALSYTDVIGSTSNGYVYKTGAGKLILGGTGGLGGIEATTGTVDVTGTYANWGNQTTRTRVGTALTVFAGGSITSTTGGGFTANGGSTMLFNGSVNTTGGLSASFDATNGVSLVTINAPSSFGTMSTSNRSGANFPGQFSTITVNANTVVSGAVTVNGSAGNGSFVNLTGTANLSGGSYSISGTVNAPAGTTLTQTGATSGLTLNSSGTLNLLGAHSIAGDFTVGGVLTKPVSYAITVGRDLNVTNGQTLPLDALTTVGRDVEVTSSTTALTALNAGATSTLNATGVLRVTGSATNAATINVAGASTVGGVVANATNGAVNFNNATGATVNGLVQLDVSGNNRADTVNFNAGTTTSVSTELRASTSTTAIASTANLVVANGATYTTGDVTFLAARTSTGTPANVLNSLLNLNVASGGTLNAGAVLLRHDQGAAATNTSTSRFQVDGTATVNSLRVESRDVNGSTIVGTRAVPNIGTYDVKIAGTLNLKPGLGNASTSVLGAVPTFTGTGKMNIADSGIVFKAATFAAVNAAVTTGAAGGSWAGPGITSSVAQAQPNTYVVGVRSNADLGLTTFRGQTVGAGDV